jgi:hypothetical protein
MAIISSDDIFLKISVLGEGMAIYKCYVFIYEPDDTSIMESGSLVSTFEV